jgi:hypothetical protein
MRHECRLDKSSKYHNTVAFVKLLVTPTNVVVYFRRSILNRALSWVAVGDSKHAQTKGK